MIKGNAYEYQYRFLLQTGLRTGELVGLKWSDIDMDRRTMTIKALYGVSPFYKGMEDW